MSGRLRGTPPIILVIVFVGAVLVLCVLGIIGLAAAQVEVPNQLGTVCVAAMTGLAGLLAPNTGLLTSGRSAARAAAAGQAAAEAVVHADEQADQEASDTEALARGAGVLKHTERKAR